MAHSTVVSPIVENIDRKTPTHRKEKNLLKDSLGISVRNFRDSFHLITGVRRESFTASYKSAWGWVVGWCVGQKIDPCHCDI